jgi:hypothetical protein
LEEFISDFPEAKAFLLYRGERKIQVSTHVTAIPVEPFLRSLTPEHPRIGEGLL